ncbi:hypothetical protein O181_008821 [Austropuccinia psidii MF-1]|uniref:Uncharacterized protein n=1 Tax=Austropuccinia psidii MF-1 TaxID=1389203 RepID=A0A9Q3GIW4_9BASI|nr:hypothetical protein [Austropuccinia psidii MF-1]
MSDLPEKIIVHLLLNEPPYQIYGRKIPYFPTLNGTLVIDTSKGGELILVFDFPNHFNESTDLRKGMITFDPAYKHSSDSLTTLSNDFFTATTWAPLLGKYRLPSFTAPVNINPKIP